MKDPVDHILRPLLPWRTADGAITECGYNASKVKTLTREEATSRFKEFGRQRFAMFTCMTCMETAERWGTWDADPRKALEREINWECQWRRTDHGFRLRDELLAIAELIAAHRDEFTAKVAEIEQRREWNEKKAALAERPKPPPKPTIIHGL
jgi:hypothetical protein